MINKSKLNSEAQSRKWQEAGSLESHPDNLEAKGFSEAKFTIDPPEQYHNNYMLSFDSSEMTDESREAYILAIMLLTKDIRPIVFFQSGSNPGAKWHMFEFWGQKNDKIIKDLIPQINDKARQRFKSIIDSRI